MLRLRFPRSNSLLRAPFLRVRAGPPPPAAPPPHDHDRCGDACASPAFRPTPSPVSRHPPRPARTGEDSFGFLDPLRARPPRLGRRAGSFRCLSGEAEGGRESLSYDVVIVGAGPAGLSAAIRLKQMCRERGADMSVCVVEKGAEVGAHILSGNVFETRALDELIPQWHQEGAPIEVPVSSDKFYFLTRNHAVPLPSPFDNTGNYVIRF